MHLTERQGSCCFYLALPHVLALPRLGWWRWWRRRRRWWQQQGWGRVAEYTDRVLRQGEGEEEVPRVGCRREGKDEREKERMREGRGGKGGIQRRRSKRANDVRVAGWGFVLLLVVPLPSSSLPSSLSFIILPPSLPPSSPRRERHTHTPSLTHTHPPTRTHTRTHTEEAAARAPSTDNVQSAAASTAPAGAVAQCVPFQ